MKKINWSALKKKLPHFEDKRQTKALVNIVRFFAVMLILTIVAMGVSGAAIPKVELAHPASGEIIQQISGSGQICAYGTKNVTAPAGISVQQVLVSVGQAVTPEDVLAQFNLDEINDQLERETQNLHTMQLKLEQLNTKVTVDSSSVKNAQNAYNWAQDDYQTQKAEGQSSVQQAQNALNQALGTQQQAQNGLDEIKARQPAPTQEEIDAAQDAVNSATASVQSAQAALDNAVTSSNDKLTQAQRAIENAQIALDSAKKQNTQQSQDMDFTNRQNQIDAVTEQLDIADEKKLIGSLQTLQKSGGKLYSPASGVVMGLSIQPGVATQSNQGVLISDPSGGWYISATFLEQDVVDLQSGLSAAIDMGHDRTVQASVTSVSKADQNGNVEVRVNIPADAQNIVQGKTVSVTIQKSKNNYSSILPIEAIRIDASGEFILVMEEKNTVLGLQNTLVKIPVQVLDKNTVSAAVQAPVAANTQVVLTSDKPVGNGDRVRVTK